MYTDTREVRVERPKLTTEFGPLDAETAHMHSLSEAQEQFLFAYRHGRIDEEKFQQHLADDPILAAHVKRLTHC